MCSLRNRSAGHIHKRHTSNLNVPFYVGDRFNEEYSGNNLKNVERSVEEDYISNLRNNCWKEKQQSKCADPVFIVFSKILTNIASISELCIPRLLQLYDFMFIEQLIETWHTHRPYALLALSEEGLMYRARYFGDSESYKRAQRMGTPSCSRLSDIQVILDG